MAVGKTYPVFHPYLWYSYPILFDETMSIFCKISNPEPVLVQCQFLARLAAVIKFNFFCFTVICILQSYSGSWGKK